jgi:hypothetical protein
MLQSIETCSSLEELFEKHIEPMLHELQASVDSWSLCSAERFVFEAVLTYAGTCTHLLLCFSLVIPWCWIFHKNSIVAHSMDLNVHYFT